MLAELARLPIEEALLMCFDLETTGINTAEDRVVQLAVSYFQNHQIIQQHTQLFNPECPIPSGASAVHGIDDATVVGQPTLKSFLPRLIPHFRGEVLGHRPPPVLVGYNLLSYDIPLFKAELTRIGYDPSLINIPTLDLIIFARWHLRHRPKLKLENLCQDFGVPLAKAHDALFDARACGLLIPYFLRSGYLPLTIGAALREQERLRQLLDQEYEDYRRWLYRDRTTGELTLGQGKHMRVALKLVDPSYLQFCIDKMKDLPPKVHQAFTARLKGQAFP